MYFAKIWRKKSCHLFHCKLYNVKHDLISQMKDWLHRHNKWPSFFKMKVTIVVKHKHNSKITITSSQYDVWKSEDMSKFTMSSSQYDMRKSEDVRKITMTSSQYDVRKKFLSVPAWMMKNNLYVDICIIRMKFWFNMFALWVICKSDMADPHGIKKSW